MIYKAKRASFYFRCNKAKLLIKIFTLKNNLSTQMFNLFKNNIYIREAIYKVSNFSGQVYEKQPTERKAYLK